MSALKPLEGRIRLTVRRCYWPAAHSLLRPSRASYEATATTEGMVLVRRELSL